MKRPPGLAVLALLAALAAGACAPPRAKTYEVRRNGRLVLTVVDAPGPLVSAALPPPGAAPVRHPFLSASAYAPEEESALRALLDKSSDTRGFLERLRAGGYTVVEGPSR